MCTFNSVGSETRDNGLNTLENFDLLINIKCTGNGRLTFYKSNIIIID